MNLLDPPPETRGLRIANLEVLINAVLYNAPAALHIMESQDAAKLKKFFGEWFEAVRDDMKLPRVHDKKLSILAMCGLLTMEPAQVPRVLQDGWTDIVTGILHTFKGLPRAIAGRKSMLCLVMQGI